MHSVHRPTPFFAGLARSIATVAFGAGLLGQAGCLGPVRGNGISSTQSRQLSGFDGVETRNSVGIEVVVDEELEGTEVSLTCDSNLHELIQLSVISDVMVVGTSPGVFVDPMTECYVEVLTSSLESLAATGSGGIDVTGVLPDLASATTSGSGGISVAGASGATVVARATGSGGISMAQLDVDSLDFKCTGSGGIDASGSANSASYVASGSGGITAKKVQADVVKATASGSGGITLTAKTSVSAKTTGSGSIQVWGEPQVESNKSTGSGEVIIH